MVSLTVVLIVKQYYKKHHPVVKRSSLENIEILYMKKHLNEEEDFKEALTQGRLAVDANCLKLAVLDSKTIYTLIWPSHFSIEIENEILVVKLKHKNKVVGQEGSNIEVSGGELPDLSDVDLVDHHHCNTAPYWLVGKEARLLK